MHAHELALKAGRQMQSPQTGLIHIGDRIPLLENAAFALALLRSRKIEQVLEAKALLEKILAFEIGGNFPVYLHDYPLCTDCWMTKRLSPYFFWAVREFGSILGPLKERLEAFIQPPNLDITPKSAADWAELCIAAQMAEENEWLQKAADHWNGELCLFTGPSQKKAQEGTEPALTLLDWMMGEWTGGFSKRALQFHPLQVRASLIRPAQVNVEKSPYIQLESEGELPFYLAWGNQAQLHTFALSKRHLTYRNGEIFFPEEVSEDDYELSFFLNLHPGHQITFGGKKASAFQLDQEICIESGPMTLKIRLLPGEGNGQFFGHLMRGNRPSQLKPEVYDWKIAIRTISREPVCSLRFQLDMDYRPQLP